MVQYIISTRLGGLNMVPKALVPSATTSDRVRLVQVWAKVEYGTINLDTTGGNYPMLAGNLTSIIISGVVVIITGLIAPQNYDWKSSMEITMVEEEETGAPPAHQP